MSEHFWRGGVGLGDIALRYRGRIAVTWLLLLGEALLILLVPLAIGHTVDTLLQERIEGVYVLGALCMLILVFGAGRRFWDTRAYSRIYHDLGTSLVGFHAAAGTATGTLSARVALLYEVVEFFEEYVPELLGGIVAFIGVLLILGAIDLEVMGLSLGATALVAVIYLLSGGRITDYTRHQNDEIERRVDVLSAGSRRRIDIHFRRLMKWNIRLSDLETLCFSLVWIVLAALLVTSIVLIVQNPAVSAGRKVTSIMYVFQYMEVVMGFPLIYQQLVRLREIMQRLSKMEET